MAEETKIVKGGFKATLALIISIIALISSVIAYTAAGRGEDLMSRIKNIQTGVEKMKNESSKQMERLRGDTMSALEKLSRAVGKKKQGEEKGRE